MLLPLLLLLLLWRLAWVEGSKDFSLKVEKQVTLQEGTCAQVPCEFTYPEDEWTDSDPARGYWFKGRDSVTLRFPVATNDPYEPVKEETRGRFLLLGDPENANCSLYIRDVRKKDKGTYFFRLEKGKLRWTYVSEPLSVQVTALTLSPNIYIPVALEAGRPSNLTCSVPWACAWSTPPIFSWTGTSVSPGTTNSSVLTLIPEPRDHGANVTCQVTVPGAGVTVETTIQLNVSYAPRNLTVMTSKGTGAEFTILENASSLPILDGQSLHLLCSVDSQPPARLSWSWEGLSLCPSQLSTPGLLELSPDHLSQRGRFTCKAQNSLGSQHVSLNLSPQSSAAVSGVTLGVFAGMGATALLFLALCLILLAARSCRRKSAKPTGVVDPNTLRCSISKSPLVESQTDDGAPPLPPTAEIAPSSTEEDEIYYASLNYNMMKSRTPQAQGQPDMTTEYSEIKTHQ